MDKLSFNALILILCFSFLNLSESKPAACEQIIFTLEDVTQSLCREFCPDCIRADQICYYCTKNCSLDPNSVINQKDNAQCLCNAGYQFNSSLSLCAKNCLAIPKAISLNLQNINQCICVQNYIWSSNVCQRNCLIDPNALSLTRGSLDQCDCASGYIWDSTKSICVRNCALIANAVSVSSTNVNQCICTNTFIWNSTQNLCVKDCSAILKATSLNLANISQCICATNYFWSTPQNNCFYNCSNDPNSCSMNTVNIGACNCKAAYYWNSSQVKCLQIINSPYNITYVTNCNLQFGFTYDYTLNTCVRICGLISFATTVNLCDTTQCNCQYGYYWNSAAKSCVPNCTLMPFATVQNANKVTSCDCVAGFIWSNIYNKCVRNCALDPYSLGLNLFNTAQCSCWLTFQWNTLSNKCACASGFVWSSFWNTCVIKLFSSNPNDDVPANPTEVNLENTYNVRKLSKNDIIAIVLSTTLGLAAVIGIIILVRKCMRKKAKNNDQSEKKTEKMENVQIDSAKQIIME